MARVPFDERSLPQTEAINPTILRKIQYIYIYIPAGGFEFTRVVGEVHSWSTSHGSEEQHLGPQDHNRPLQTGGFLLP